MADNRRQMKLAELRFDANETVNALGEDWPCVVPAWVVLYLLDVTEAANELRGLFQREDRVDSSYGAEARAILDAWSCDLLPTEGDPAKHIEGDVLPILGDGWMNDRLLHFRYQGDDMTPEQETPSDATGPWTQAQIDSWRTPRDWGEFIPAAAFTAFIVRFLATVDHDRAALEAVRKLHRPIDGWCPACTGHRRCPTFRLADEALR